MTTNTRFSWPLRLLAAFVALITLLVLLVVFFPWDRLREPINRYVSEKTGRHFAITRHLDVRLGRLTTVRADGIEFANPAWAREPWLVKAEAAEFDIRLWPLLFDRKVELPRVSLTQPEVGLQIEADGKRTWVLSQDSTDTGSVPVIGSLLVDRGTLKYYAKAQGADLSAQFALLTEAASELPLSYRAEGKWQGESFTAQGRTGGVLQLSQDMTEPFPLEVNAASGRTSLKAKGTITNLSEFAGVDATFDIQGRNLDELFKLTGVVLPSTPPYRLRGKLGKSGKVWSASAIQGLLGSSDISGALDFDQSGKVALLRGKVQSKVLDFVDLAPVIGVPTGSASAARPAATSTAVASAAPAPVKTVPKTPGRKVLPTATLDLVKLQSMNADVVYSAADIRHVEQLPLDRGSVHVKLSNGVLQLDPIALGVAGGSLAGRITIDSKLKPAAFDTRLDVRGLQLNQLFPTVQTTKSSFGKISGQIDLKGRGNSAAQMLGSASGDVAVLMGKGELSNILMEFMGLDGGEVIKFLVRGDRNVQLRCAAAAFDVKDGLMTSKAIVLDTSDTVVNGRGQVSLANETLDLTLEAAPKDRSILSFRSPLKVGGTFANPSAGPDKLALAGRLGLAVGLGLINPFLALAATIETGPGQDESCREVLAQGADPKGRVKLPVGAPDAPADKASAPRAAASAPRN